MAFTGSFVVLRKRQRLASVRRGGSATRLNFSKARRLQKWLFYSQSPSQPPVILYLATR